MSILTYAVESVSAAHFLDLGEPKSNSKLRRRSTEDAGHHQIIIPIKKAQHVSAGLFKNNNLVMTYSHMGKPHTTIGDDTFHF